MLRAPAWVVAVATLVGTAALPSAARAGVWMTLAAGLPGGSAPTAESEVLFDTMHGPPLVAVNQLAGGTAQAVTGGGTVSFGGLGTPVLLNLADGSAYVASGSVAPPASATTRGPGGTSAGTPATAAPVAGGTAPSDAALLGITLADPDAAGVRALTATLTDAAGNLLGTGNLSVPDGGYWILGLGTAAATDPGAGNGGDDGGTIPPPPPIEPPPVTTPPPPPPPSDGGGAPVSTPEPSTIALVGIGGVATTVWRRARARWAAV